MGVTQVRRVAILDDYQQVARGYADWESLPAGTELTFFDEPQSVGALQPYDVIVAMRERSRFPAEVLERLPGLRLLVTTGMVNASIDLAAAERLGIVVCGTGSGPSGAVVELTWALILALARHIPVEDQQVRAGGWQQTVGTSLSGQRLGVVGLGRLGAPVARVGVAFGMEVVAWSPHLDAERARAAGATAVTKDELLETADVVTLHVPLKPDSAGLISRADLARMKPTALLVNTSRGPLVDEDALLEALRDARIGGAGLDVFSIEPLPADSPWRSAPRTVLTPHLGYVSHATYQVFYPDAVDDIRAFAAGAPVRTLKG
jgi:phosphoglycerate dehydrogenase-like enzyme